MLIQSEVSDERFSKWVERRFEVNLVAGDEDDPSFNDDDLEDDNLNDDDEFLNEDLDDGLGSSLDDDDDEYDNDDLIADPEPA